MTEIAVPESLHKQISPLVAAYQAENAALTKALEDLQKRELTQMTAAMAVEIDTRAKGFETNVMNAFEPTVSVLWNTHRAATAVRSKLLGPVKPLRTLCAGIISRWALEQEKARQAAPAPQERAAIVERQDDVLAGVSLQEKWIGNVTEIYALAKHIVAHPELVFLLQPAQADLDEYITRMQGKVELPGVTIEKQMVKRNRNK